jgi:hypothetical protein
LRVSDVSLKHFAAWLAGQVHGEAIMREPRLRKRGAALERGLQATWGRVDGLFQGTRSMLAFLGNLAA